MKAETRKANIAHQFKKPKLELLYVEFHHREANPGKKSFSKVGSKMLEHLCVHWRGFECRDICFFNILL